MMEYRNPQFTATGDITCEVNHWRWGWIPYTASANDASSADLFATITDAGNIAAYVAPTPPTAEEILEAQRAQMVVSRFQAKAALAAAGLLTQAETVVAAADATTQLAWAEVIEFRRNSPTIAALKSAMSLSDEQLDALFVAAAAIEA